MLIISLMSTVALLVWMGFFMLGSLPLLVLKHDTPLDSRFIRGLFNVYYLAIMITGAAGALSWTLAGRPNFAVAVGILALVGLAGRHWMIGRMDALRATMTADDAAGIARFRRLHIAGMLLNFMLLAALCVGMTKVSL